MPNTKFERTHRPSGRMMPEVSCQGKRQYADHIAAHRAAQAMMSYPDYDGHPFSGYKCIHCGFFHVGHTPHRAAKRKERVKAWRKRKEAKAREIDQSASGTTVNSPPPPRRSHDSPPPVTSLSWREELGTLLTPMESGEASTPTISDEPSR